MSDDKYLNKGGGGVDALREGRIGDVIEKASNLELSQQQYPAHAQQTSNHPKSANLHTWRVF